MTDATRPQPDLKTLIQRLEKRHKDRQVNRAIVAGSALLVLAAAASPFLMHEQAAPIAVEPAPMATEPAPDAYADVRLTGKAAIVYDLTTDEIIFQRNSKMQLPLASLTKLITMYAAADALGPDSIVTVSETALAEEGESGLMPGETFAFTDAAKLALVASSNDMAEAVAEAAASSRSTDNRNLLASAVSALGLPQTYALNGTGLDESTTVSGGYGSAFDVAKLAGALLTKAPAIARATTESSVSVRATNGTLHTLPNTNQDVVHIPNLLLSKTGFTDLAGGNLAIVYDAGIGHPVAIVVLGSTREGRFADVEKLLALTLDHFAGIAPSNVAAAHRAF